MSTVVDLGAVGAQGFIAVGDDAHDRAGWSTSDAGDINGDGLDDVVIGSRTGSAYVIFGQAAGFGTVDLGNLQASDGFVLESLQGDVPGFSVSSAGDVNGDGFDDLIVGGTLYSWYYGSTPSAYVIFGKASGFGTVNVSDLAAPEGFRIVGPSDYGYFGLTVASAGDVNGDGFDDVIVGSPYELGGAGSAYVIFGKANGLGFVDLTTLPSATGFKIIGEPGSYDFAGSSVSGAGDVNGDGFDDLIIGVPYGDNGGADAGEAYVIFGKAAGFGTIDLSNLAAGAGFAIQGDEAGDTAGWSVSAAGDVNGDGFDDVIVGAAYGDNGGIHSGEAYVIFGKATGFGTIDLTNLAPGAGFVIQGDDTGDHAGWSVSAAGDVNGDGFDDLIVGAPGNDNTRGGAPRVIDAGEAYVIFGKAGGFGTIDVTNLAPSDGFIIQGEAAYDLAGRSVSAAGDVDGDGFDDLVVGAPYSDRGSADAGAAFIISGGLHFATDVRNDFNGDGRSDILWRNNSGAMVEWLGQADGSFANNPSASGQVPTDWFVIGNGDFNGDGREDILWRNETGAFVSWRGEASGGFVNNINGSGQVPANWFVTGTGDFNGDHRDDILWRNDAGAFVSWLGQANGSFANNQNGFGQVSTNWQVTGTGDFNGDGRDDILWRSDTGGFVSWLGQANGSFANNSNGAGQVSTNWQVSGTGDFNGDGRDDIVWRSATGAFVSWLGQANGTFANNSNGSGQVSTNWHLIGADDYNGDWRDDILWRSDTGAFVSWLGQANGGFVNDSKGSGQVGIDWQVQPNPAGLGIWDY